MLLTHSHFRPALHVGGAVVDINGAVAEVIIINADIGAAVEVVLRAFSDAKLARCRVFYNCIHPWLIKIRKRLADLVGSITISFEIECSAMQNIPGC